MVNAGEVDAFSQEVVMNLALKEKNETKFKRKNNEMTLCWILAGQNHFGRKFDSGSQGRTLQRYPPSCLMRSNGLITSVIRTPNFSFTTTTSPRATSFPFTSTSRGSPTCLFNSITEP